MCVSLAALGLHCCMQAFVSCGEWGRLSPVVHGLLTVAASLVAEGGPRAEAQQLQHTGSVAVAFGLSCPMVCGIFLPQGSNLCPPHWQVDS